MYIYTLFSFYDCYNSGDLENIFLDLETAIIYAKNLIEKQKDYIKEILICRDEITEKGRRTVFHKRIKNENWKNL